jgi:hypothetical protein
MYCRPLILHLSCFRSQIFLLTNEWSIATDAKSSLLDNYCNQLGSPSSSMVNDHLLLSSPESFQSLVGPKQWIFVAEFLTHSKPV